MGKLVSVTGPIATGATTFCNSLAEITSWHTFLEEDVERTNPFFSLYYTDPTRYTFHNQIAFLTKSAEIHKRLKDSLLGKNIYLQDYSPFEHTEVYAYVQFQLGKLAKEEYDLLVRLTKAIEPLFVVPDVLVYRPLTKDRLLERVRIRNRPSEQGVDLDFLESVRVRFEDWVNGWDRSPVFRVDENLDITSIEGKKELERLGKGITELIGP